jgi:cysteinyl-tRNA synthetase
MDDDFNTPEALAVLFDLAREINRKRALDTKEAAPLAATLRQLGALLGVLQDDPDAVRKATTPHLAASLANEVATGAREQSLAKAALAGDEIDDLIVRRAAAREANDWHEADRIRNLLQAQGVVLEDGAGGTTKWRRV